MSVAVIWELLVVVGPRIIIAQGNMEAAHKQEMTVALGTYAAALKVVGIRLEAMVAGGL